MLRLGTDKAKSAGLFFLDFDYDETDAFTTCSTSTSDDRSECSFRIEVGAWMFRAYLF